MHPASGGGMPRLLDDLRHRDQDRRSIGVSTVKRQTIFLYAKINLRTGAL